MKLLVVSQYFWPENFRINDICDGLVERGHQVDVLTSLPNVPQGRFYDGYGWFKCRAETHNGINIERVRVVPRGNGSGLRWVLNCGSFALGSLFHIPKLRKNDYDAVFVFNNSPVSKLLPAKRIAKIKKIPNVVFILDIWPESMFFLLGMPENGKETWFKRISRNISRWLYKSGDLLLISSKGFEYKLRAMGLDGKIAYFPNYAEPLPYPQISDISRGELGLNEGDFVVGFAGNIGKAQGLDKLVSAASILRDKNCRYLILGDGSELEALKQQVDDAGLNQRFVFTGWVDSKQVPAYLALCDAALVPLEDHEILNITVPAKLQTYMYAGKPVIAFMNGAGASIVDEAKCGVTAAAGDVDALCAAIAHISSKSQRELSLLGNNGRRYCTIHFDRDKLLDSLEQHIQTAIDDYRKKTR